MEKSPEFWEVAFQDKQLMWGHEPTRSAERASAHFAARAAKNVLLPGVGYGRNALPFLARGMDVTGIEISETAIALARRELGLSFPIHHGSVTDMPFDDRTYDGIFCFGLLYLLGPLERAKFLADCARQLGRGASMIFTLIEKHAPMYGRGEQLGPDWYEIMPGVKMFFYDEASVRAEFGPCGAVEIAHIEEPSHGNLLPFLYVECTPAVRHL